MLIIILLSSLILQHNKPINYDDDEIPATPYTPGVDDTDKDPDWKPVSKKEKVNYGLANTSYHMPDKDSMYLLS